MSNRKICVVGMGYVGLPLAVAFGLKQRVIGFDINKDRIIALQNNNDSTKETDKDELLNADVEYTSDSAKIKECDFIIVAVPTPVNDSKIPDMTALRAASKTVGENLSAGSIVVYESTVYPGVTENICAPILEKESGLVWGKDFKIGYSPERINPGDKKHTLSKIVKIVSAQDEATLDVVAQVYGSIITAGVHSAQNIKTAESAKVIENIQRDLNIALMNELSVIFNKIGVDTLDVIDAACTKWNFNRYLPGLVGGHCIGVDPFYMTYLAQKLGIHPKVILAGRETNDGMSKYVSELVLKGLNHAGLVLKDTTVLLMGLTFKENVPDKRNSRAFDLVNYLREYSVNVIGCDPMIPYGEVNGEREGVVVENIPFDKLEKFDCAILVNGHDDFKNISLDVLMSKMNRTPILIDVKSFYSKKEAIEKGFVYKSL